MMRTDFSKPASDIAVENARWQAEDAQTLARQRQLSRAVREGEARRHCVLCAASLAAGTSFDHRGVAYVHCPACDQVQSQVQPPARYPNHNGDELGFDRIYPELDAAAYVSRRDRIYAPKLTWALARLEDAGISRASALRLPWRDLGAGAGYFLDALRDAGAKDLSGVEQTSKLAQIANAALASDMVAVHDDSLAAALDRSRPTAHVALFVLEHVENANVFWSSLAETSSGSVFLFAVPCFGFSTLLESAFSDHAARNLDSVLHTQLYTDRSIARALDLAGYEMAAEWVFGQDAADLRQLLLGRLRACYPDALLTDLSRDLGKIVDPMQTVIDKARLADARHVLAIKR